MFFFLSQKYLENFNVIKSEKNKLYFLLYKLSVMCKIIAHIINCSFISASYKKIKIN